MTDITNDQQGPIAQVREGMRVVDSTGEVVGSVRGVRMGDPGAVTAAGQGTGDTDGTGGIVGAAIHAIAGDELPDGARERLERVGYVRVDARGLFSGDRYVAADEIADVTDEVRLTVPKDTLLG